MPNVYKCEMEGHINKWRPEKLLGCTWRFSFKWRPSFTCREPHYEKPLKTCPSPVIIRSVQSSKPRGKGNKARIGNTQKYVDKFSCRNWRYLWELAIKQQDVRICTEVLWLQTGPSGRVLWKCTEHFGSIKFKWNFFTSHLNIIFWRRSLFHVVRYLFWLAGCLFG